jgi:hypothetical protein
MCAETNMKLQKLKVQCKKTLMACNKRMYWSRNGGLSNQDIGLKRQQVLLGCLLAGARHFPTYSAVSSNLAMGILYILPTCRCLTVMPESSINGRLLNLKLKQVRNRFSWIRRTWHWDLSVCSLAGGFELLRGVRKIPSLARVRATVPTHQLSQRLHLHLALAIIQSSLPFSWGPSVWLQT